MRLRAVIFDLDGTLVDSQLDFQAMRSEMEIGPEPILETIAKLSPPRRAYCEAILARHEWEGAERSTPCPGAREWIRSLDDRGIPRAIFTRNARAIALRSLAKSGLPFTEIIAREDAAAKPDPEGIHRLCATWRITPREVLVIGDYLYDLQAAQNAGAVSALVTNGRSWSFEDQAHHVWKTLDAGLFALPHLFG